MRKKYLSALSILALALVVIMPVNSSAQEVDFSAIVGKWEISMEGRQGDMITQNWEFFLKDNKLCAKIEGGMGGGRRGGGQRGGGGTPPPMEVEGIDFDGENLSFEMERGRGDRVFVIEYTAKVKDGKMEGEMAFGDRGGREFTGKKK